MLTRVRITSLLMLFLAIPAWSASPVILSAVINNLTNQISITGGSFSSTGTAPTVALDNSTLVLVSFTDRTVVANMPTGLKAGSYRLSLTNSVANTATFDVTIGAAPGPELVFVTGGGITTGYLGPYTIPTCGP